VSLSSRVADIDIIVPDAEWDSKSLGKISLKGVDRPEQPTSDVYFFNTEA
jgi:hypothetical protein